MEFSILLKCRGSTPVLQGVAQRYICVLTPTWLRPASSVVMRQGSMTLEFRARMPRILAVFYWTFSIVIGRSCTIGSVLVFKNKFLLRIYGYPLDMYPLASSCTIAVSLFATHDFACLGCSIRSTLANGPLGKVFACQAAPDTVLEIRA